MIILSCVAGAVLSVGLIRAAVHREREGALIWIVVSYMAFVLIMAAASAVGIFG
jgi:hypothetical protein